MTRGNVRQKVANLTSFRTALGVGLLGLGSLSLITATSVAAGAPTSTLLADAHLVGGAAQTTGAISYAYNWSGYATTSGPYHAVTANWTVPTVSGPGTGGYSAAWVGIDGFNNNSLIQTGTEQDYYGGSGHYSAWWTTSSQNFAEQTITTGCTSAGTIAGASATSAAPGVLRAAPPGHSPQAGGFAPARSRAPSARTQAASNVTSLAATLNGTVNPNGTPTSYYFEYGTSTKFGSNTATVSAGSGTSTINVSANLTNLAASTNYYFQLVASNSRGTTLGGIASFTTSAGGSGGGGSSCGTVAATDQITASITETNAATSAWAITITDNSASHGWSFTQDVTYTGPGASAEWILEAPELCSYTCQIAPLANYGSETFDPGTANGVNPALSTSDEIGMVNSTGTRVISTPSAPDSDTDGFTVAYGSTALSPPSS